MLKMSHGIPVVAAALLLAGCASADPEPKASRNGNEISDAINAEVDAALAVYTEPEEEVPTEFPEGVAKEEFAKAGFNSISKDLLVLSLSAKDAQNAEFGIVVDKTAKTLSMQTPNGKIVFSFPKRKMLVLEGEDVLDKCDPLTRDFAYLLYGAVVDSVRVAKSVKLQSHSMFEPGTTNAVEEADTIRVDGDDCKRFDVELKPSCGAFKAATIYVSFEDGSIIRADLQMADGSVKSFRVFSEPKNDIPLPTKIADLNGNAVLTIVDSSVKLVPPPEPPKQLVGVKEKSEDKKTDESAEADNEKTYADATEEGLAGEDGSDGDAAESAESESSDDLLEDLED